MGSGAISGVADEGNSGTRIVGLKVSDPMAFANVRRRVNFPLQSAPGIHIRDGRTVWEKRIWNYS
jgi:hypothetical protein